MKQTKKHTGRTLVSKSVRYIPLDLPHITKEDLRPVPTKLRLFRLIRDSQQPCSLTNAQLAKELGVGVSTVREKLAELEKIDGVISRSYHQRVLTAKEPAKSYEW